MSSAFPGSPSIPSVVQPFAPRMAWRAHANAAAAEPLQVDLATLIALLGGASDGCSTADGNRFAVRRVARGATLVHEGAHADVIYAVQTGSFKIVKTAEDGYEHVLGQGWRGDVIGLDGLYGAHYAFAAVALEDSRAVALPLVSLDALRHGAPAFDAALQSLVSRQLRHIGEVAELMAAVAADVRLARFLVQLSARMAERGQSPHRLLLRMNRRDIANYLGLAHETISRSFRVLSDAGYLCVNDREVEILDLEGLRRCARSTRGEADEEPKAHPQLARVA